MISRVHPSLIRLAVIGALLVGMVAMQAPSPAYAHCSSQVSNSTNQIHWQDNCTVSQGSSNTYVAAVQASLHLHSFNPGSVDGIFGPNTRTAVRNFQSARGLSVDGIVGPQTWSELQKLVNRGCKTSGSSTWCEWGSTTYQVRNYSSGSLAPGQYVRVNTKMRRVGTAVAW
jgi:peptidoglycan hydrolase-like protein with peptidoglycan-binding domain